MTESIGGWTRIWIRLYCVAKAKHKRKTGEQNEILWGALKYIRLYVWWWWRRRWRKTIFFFQVHEELWLIYFSAVRLTIMKTFSFILPRIENSIVSEILLWPHIRLLLFFTDFIILLLREVINFNGAKLRRYWLKSCMLMLIVAVAISCNSIQFRYSS